jgi:uncharacterized protein
MITIPLFPLATILFPDGYLPLRIFEVRYLSLVKTCLAEEQAFGVTTLHQGSETRVPNQETRFAEVGTMARILQANAVEPNLLYIRCQGAQRFRIQQSRQLSNGLWMADVDMLEDDHVVAIPDELDDTARALGHLIAALQKEGLPAHQFPLLPPFRLDECGWVSNRWCDLLPLSPEEKQRMLCLDNPVLRLELVQDLLNARGWLE